MQDNELESLLISAGDAPASGESASTRLKSRIYSALMLEAAADGPLLDLDATIAAGHGLCVFEKLVQIAPVGAALKSFNYCRVCHGRLMGESIEDPPLYWVCCPYAEFRKT